MKTFELDKLVRKNIQELDAYQVWRDDYLNKENVIFLDNCENNYGSPLGLGYERYPNSSQKEVKRKVAELKNIDDAQLVLGNGSDELIDLLIRCFCEPKKDSLLVCEPTFGMFKIYAQINETDVLNAPLNKSDFTFDVDLILNTVKQNTKLIFICSPNNPTGTSVTKEQVYLLCQKFNGIVVLDEAYIDFSSKGSFVDLINKFPNLVILQTFSKAWGLAQLRLGVLIGNQEIISVVNKTRPPYNICGVSQKLIIEAIEKKSVFESNLTKILAQKNIVKDKLSKLKFVERIIESDANYFMIKVADANKLVVYLLNNGILISNRTNLLNCENFVRISIGTEIENERLIMALKKFED